MTFKCSFTGNQSFKKKQMQNFMFQFKKKRFIGLVGRVFANGPGDLGSIPGRVIPKT